MFSPGRKGWDIGARALPAHAYRYSFKMPARGFDGDSQKTLRDLVKDVREKTNVKYAKIGQCNEDCLYDRATDVDTYPAHIYDRSKMLVLVTGVLGLPDGRFMESTGAKANVKLQDVRLNLKLEPIDMQNALCAGTLDRPLAIYMMPVVEGYDGAQLTEDVASHKRASVDANRKDPTDMQQEGEDNETHDMRLYMLKCKRISEAKLGTTKADDPVFEKPKPVAAKSAKQVRKLPMHQFNGRKNALLGSWSATPSSSEHRALI